MTPLLNLLAQAGEAYHYRPFITPAPVWDQWYVLLLPICLAVAIVYKSIKCDSMKRVPREALTLFVIILFVMAMAAGALAGLVKALER
jgi:hypothetical protein